MEDEPPLECFRKAIELGCPDLALCDKSDKPELIGKPMLVAQGERPNTDEIKGCCLPSDVPRINRYAAAVCAEWWALRAEQPEFIDVLNVQLGCRSRINQARAFGKKYGQ